MARSRFGVIPRFKAGIWILALQPVLILVDRLFVRRVYLGFSFVADPVELIQHWTGTTALVLLFATLLITPLRRLTGYKWLIKYRRLIGMFAFFYATLHVFSYFIFDHRLNLDSILDDVLEHRWVLVGFAAWVLIIPLAVTSTTGWIRRLGGKKWSRLHRLIYLAAPLVVLHFLWQVKLERTEPLYYAAALGIIMLARVFVKPRPKISPERSKTPNRPSRRV